MSHVLSPDWPMHYQFDLRLLFWLEYDVIDLLKEQTAEVPPVPFNHFIPCDKRFQLLFKNWRFGCYCNITHCCKSHYENVCQVFVTCYNCYKYPSGRTPPPRPQKVVKTKLYPLTCYAETVASRHVALCCEADTKKLTFSITAVPLFLSRWTFLRRQKIPETDTVSKCPTLHSYAMNPEVNTILLSLSIISHK